jgi:hypothetical protein
MIEFRIFGTRNSPEPLVISVAGGAGHRLPTSSRDRANLLVKQKTTS